MLGWWDGGMVNGCEKVSDFHAFNINITLFLITVFPSPWLSGSVAFPRPTLPAITTIFLTTLLQLKLWFKFKAKTCAAKQPKCIFILESMSDRRQHMIPWLLFHSNFLNLPCAGCISGESTHPLTPPVFPRLNTPSSIVCCYTLKPWTTAPLTFIHLHPLDSVFI